MKIKSIILTAIIALLSLQTNVFANNNEEQFNQLIQNNAVFDMLNNQENNIGINNEINNINTNINNIDLTNINSLNNNLSNINEFNSQVDNPEINNDNLFQILNTSNDKITQNKNIQENTEAVVLPMSDASEDVNHCDIVDLLNTQEKEEYQENMINNIKDEPSDIIFVPGDFYPVNRKGYLIEDAVIRKDIMNFTPYKTVSQNTVINIIAENTNFYKILMDNYQLYVEKDFVSLNLQDLELIRKETAKAKKNSSVSQVKYNWNGSILSKNKGVNHGPSGKETYYNLPMQGVINIMRRLGNNNKYWIRKDGCKMLGNYIIAAANLKVRPRGSIVNTSLGKAIVCDTGSFAKRNAYQLDIATTW